MVSGKTSEEVERQLRWKRPEADDDDVDDGICPTLYTRGLEA